ncbi:MAG: hypothetical protein OXH52_00345, partial [Gammaproteobacteria bacterium]|nr:hypothetical protein [Gammaproteobacteria bacterium]
MPIKAQHSGWAGWAKKSAWAGVKDGTPEGLSDFMAPVLRQTQFYGYLRHYHGTDVSAERQR